MRNISMTELRDGKYNKSLWLALDEEWDYYSGNQYQGSMNRLSSLGLR
jgi:hypothetical protein